MALGDGIRRNLATVSKEERDLLLDAIIQLNQQFYSPTGSRSDFPAGHVSYWFKQDEIHQGSHVHGCPAFLPWHRELCNRFEALLRTIHPQLSLHYWDWNLDPANMPDGQGGVINLFDASFMGNADGTVNQGSVGEPLLSAGFYINNPSDPNPANGQYRDNNSPLVINMPNPADPSTWNYPPPPAGETYNPADPPKTLTRDKQPGAPPVGQGAWPSDQSLINAATWEDFRDLMYGDEQGTSGTGAHGEAHGYIGGNLGDPHLSFRDPFVFFLHSNIDRLWAMWQRQPGHSERLDPDQVYNTEGNTTGSGDVGVGDPFWGILSPLEPWAGWSAQTAATGTVTGLIPVRPWYAPENEQNLPGNYKNSKDLSVVIPPSYDTAPHSSYIIANQEIFSSAQAAAGGTFSKAFYVVYDGFQPREVGTPSTTNPAFTFTIGGSPVTGIAVANPQLLLEDPMGAPDLPQRVTIAYDLVFSNLSIFPSAPGAETTVIMQATLSYTIGGTTNNYTDTSTIVLGLVNQPMPYMDDIDPNIPAPGPANPYWLSTDTRVFQVQENGNLAGVTQLTDPFQFITQLVNNFNSLPNDNNHPFLTQLTQDEDASQLELSPTVGGVRVFNYAVAKIRYKGPVPAAGVSAFFRIFRTMVSALDYDNTSATASSGNYRRSGNTPGSVPLLGLESNEIASIPFFAAPRVDTGTQSMLTQPEASINTNIQFQGTGQEEVMYCGVWLDINDITNQRFPLDPTADPGGLNGPYQNPRLTIQQLMAGFHCCMVTEIFYWPSGTTTDPIPPLSTPSSSDHLAQRNLALDNSGNPGWPATHTVQHSFLLKPSTLYGRKQVPNQGNAAVLRATEDKVLIGPDELMIQWGNVPLATQATLFLPEISADDILSLATLRQSPAVLSKVDTNTIAVKIAPISYIPIPARQQGNLAGLISLTLPQGIRVGQEFKFSVQQYSGIQRFRRALRMLGAFQFNIPVITDPELLPKTVKKLSLMKFIYLTIPAASRWNSIFLRWMKGLADKITMLGGNPGQVQPSPTGGDTGLPCPIKHPCEKEPCRPGDLMNLNIPWSECDLEGEIELRLKFRKKGKSC